MCRSSSSRCMDSNGTVENRAPRWPVLGKCTPARGLCGAGYRDAGPRRQPDAMPRTLADDGELEALWAHHHAELRDPHQIASQWQWSEDVDPKLLEFTVEGDWWQCLANAGLTL